MATQGAELVTSYRNVIEKGGKFEPEAGRYHLYVSYACPWAGRTLITRKLKGLEDVISLTIVSPRMGEKGWPFASVDSYPSAEEDPLYGSQYIRDLYLRADPGYAGRFSVPVLWDKKLHTVVNNESAEIVRIFNTAFNSLLPEDKAKIDLYPPELRAEIDETNDWVLKYINSGVYKTGLAATQEEYQDAVTKVFNALDRTEEILEKNEYLVGNRLTEADVRLFVTLIRFDPVYVGHFKCNIRTIRDGYPAINKWMQKLYWTNDAFKSSTKFDHIKLHYYHEKHLNPTQIVPVGPVPDILPL
ncbi:hypothetical protein AX16_006840 [Volvariella volvacea WC 439]|nr:hypothetical protein AX16_006840 [Volvariella volvacea WC 439]